MIGTSPKYGVIQRYRISARKFRVLETCFCVDTTALQAAKICLLNRHTAQRYFAFFKRLIVYAAWEERTQYAIGNGVEVDESYFGPRRVRGKQKGHCVRVTQAKWESLHPSHFSCFPGRDPSYYSSHRAIWQ